MFFVSEGLDTGLLGQGFFKQKSTTLLVEEEVRIKLKW
jgi:hypothetical protein